MFLCHNANMHVKIIPMINFILCYLCYAINLLTLFVKQNLSNSLSHLSSFIEFKLITPPCTFILIAASKYILLL